MSSGLAENEIAFKFSGKEAILINRPSLRHVTAKNDSLLAPGCQLKIAT